MILAPNLPLQLSGNKITSMRFFFIFLFFLNVLTFQASAQDYRTHKVEKDDTVYSLSQKYNTTEEAIYELNPGSKRSIRLGQILVIPPEEFGADEVKEPLRFENYVVQKKETVFGISQQNGIDIADLKKYNPYLYKEELGMGDTIRIPVYTKGKPEPINYNESIQNSTFGNLKHVVLPKETKFGIAQKYNIEVQRLKELNPNMGTIQPGQVLVVSRKENNVEEADQGSFQYYTVKHYDQGTKETVYSLTKKFGITKEALFALNPNLERDGLEAGMRIKIPKEEGENSSYSIFSSGVVNLADHIQNFDTKELVVMLPFKLNDYKADTLSRRDQLNDNKLSQISLDFYSGVLMALNSAKSHGISVNLRTYDTEGSQHHAQEILRNKDFRNIQAVIGPLLGNVVETTAQELSRKEIPVFSPLTKMEMKAYDNLIQTRPTDQYMRDVMISYMDSIHTNQNIVIITDTENQQIKNRLKARFPGARVFVTTINQEDDYLKQEEVAKYLTAQKENWIILETKNELLLNVTTSYLHLLQSDYNIQLFTTSRNDAYESDEVSNGNLSSLKFTFPAFTREFNDEKATQFIEEYKEKHGIKPSKFAVRGYDLTYDILLRLAASKDFYGSLSAPWTTEYVENKFHYKKKEDGGYVNNAVYILQYGEDLTLKPIKI